MVFPCRGRLERGEEIIEGWEKPYLIGEAISGKLTL